MVKVITTTLEEFLSNLISVYEKITNQDREQLFQQSSGISSNRVCFLQKIINQGYINPDENPEDAEYFIRTVLQTVAIEQMEQSQGGFLFSGGRANHYLLEAELSRAEEWLFERIIQYVAHQLEKNVKEEDGIGECDFSFTRDNKRYFLECKRVRTNNPTNKGLSSQLRSKIYTKLSDADRQIRKTKDKYRDEPHQYGAAIVDIGGYFQERLKDEKSAKDEIGALIEEISLKDFPHVDELILCWDQWVTTKGLLCCVGKPILSKNLWAKSSDGIFLEAVPKGPDSGYSTIGLRLTRPSLGWLSTRTNMSRDNKKFWRTGNFKQIK